MTPTALQNIMQQQLAHDDPGDETVPTRADSESRREGERGMKTARRAALPTLLMALLNVPAGPTASKATFRFLSPGRPPWWALAD